MIDENSVESISLQRNVPLLQCSSVRSQLAATRVISLVWNGRRTLTGARHTHTASCGAVRCAKVTPG